MHGRQRRRARHVLALALGCLVLAGLVEQSCAWATVAPAVTNYQEARSLGIDEVVERYGRGLRAEEAQTIAASIVYWARRYEIDPLLVTAIIHVESRFNPQAISSAGARGLMQVMPATARWLATQRERRPPSLSDLYEPDLNLELGACYFAYLLREFNGIYEYALLAYNAGPGAARRILGSRWARQALDGYPRMVLDFYHQLQNRS